MFKQQCSQERKERKHTPPTHTPSRTHTHTLSHTYTHKTETKNDNDIFFIEEKTD